MIRHSTLTDQQLRLMLRAGELNMAGNAKLKIYGTLHCASGKRMKKENRVFFSDEQQAIEAGFRPCGHCMKLAYMKWKNATL